ncbi:MAG: hypothetical protein OER95_02930 [Acidimicrobiia bacterium]|nr:hypothetical protein [Acidimicrobiia bacterium]
MPSDHRSGAAGTESESTVPPLHDACETFSLQLAAVADGGSELDPDAASHFESCLRCQAELVQYKKLLRALASLRTQRLAADETLVQEILLALEPGGTVHRLQRITAGSKSRKAAYIGGIAAAATAGAAGAFVIASKLASRQRLAS